MYWNRDWERRERLARLALIMIEDLSVWLSIRLLGLLMCTTRHITAEPLMATMHTSASRYNVQVHVCCQVYNTCRSEYHDTMF